jgi:hypothetical protein
MRTGEGERLRAWTKFRPWLTDRRARLKSASDWPTVQGRGLMNFRVFLLIAAIAVFGALWSSDGRYQAEQVTLARAARARSSNAAEVLITRMKTELVKPALERAIKLAGVARSAAASQAMLPVPKPRPIRADVNEAVAVDALFGRVLVACVFNVDPGNGVKLVTGQATLAKARLEERFCLLRFRTRQAAFLASRRATAFLRAQMSAPSQPGRFARITIREVPIEESQAPATGGRQTR